MSRPVVLIAFAFFCVTSHDRSARGDDASDSSPAAEQAIAESVNAALQGDSRGSLRALRAVSADEFAGQDADYRACMLGRFGATSPPPLADPVDDPFVGDALALYQSYWWRALLSPSERAAWDADLQGQLRTLLGNEATDDDWDVLEERVSKRMRERGYYAQLGRTPPLRELMIWRTQDSRIYDVVLPEGSHSVRVELLDDFVSRGWSYFARCGLGSSGGWATKDRLYAVVPWFENDLDSDKFRASLLGHETQHFADLERFPGIETWELEYRAKLTELWTARDSLPTLLAKFAANQSDDKDSPHTYANTRVLIALRDRLREPARTPKPDLTDVPADALRAAARDQLLEDSQSRRAASSKNAEDGT
jgi:hypothetical protein